MLMMMFIFNNHKFYLVFIPRNFFMQSISAIFLIISIIMDSFKHETKTRSFRNINLYQPTTNRAHSSQSIQLHQHDSSSSAQLQQQTDATVIITVDPHGIMSAWKYCSSMTSHTEVTNILPCTNEY